LADLLIDKNPLFAKMNLDMGESKLYEKVFQKLTFDAPKPDLILYLQASTDVLLARIDNHGLAFERTIDRDYLERLNEVYSELFLYYDDAPLLRINAREIDLANSAADYKDLVNYLLDIHSGRHYFNPTFFR
jgi:deoxyguanosine kinase